jgi:outer membrane protein
MSSRQWKLVSRILSAVMVCGFALFTTLASAAVDQVVLEQAEALIKAGKSEEAYKLLEPHEVVGAGDLVYDNLLATAALESGRPSKATFIFERILAVEPGYVGVRADMGRAYFALGDYGRAKIEFESVLAVKNIPLDLRGTVEQYAKAAEARSQAKKTVATGYAEFGVGRDNNIGSTTDQATLELPAFGLYLPAPPTGLKTPDSYSTLGLGGEITHQLTDNWGVFGGGDYRGRNYRDNTDLANGSLDLRTGVSYSGGAWLVRGGLTGGKFWQKGELLRNSVGATADWRLSVEGGTQYSAGLSANRATFAQAALSKEDMNTYALNVGWLKSLGDGSTVISLTGSAGLENSIGGRDDGDKRFWGPRVFVQKTFSEALGGYASLGATKASYVAVNPLYLFARDEVLYDIALGLTWTVAKGLSIRPQLSLAKNVSNADLYSYDKADFSINARYDF